MMRTLVFGFAALLVAVAMPTNALAFDILFVHDADGSGDGGVPANAAADTAMINRLSTTLGHTVDTHEDVGVTLAITTAKDYDFIVVSSTIASGNFATNDSGDGSTGAQNSLATDATVVMMEGGNAVLGAFNLNGSSGTGTETGTSINILADDGYVTSGFAPGALTIFSAASTIGSFGTLFPQGTTFGFPMFDFLGTALSEVPSTALPGFNVVNTGTQTVGDNTIVVLPFHNGAFTQANANGLQLFDNVFIPEPATSLLLALAATGLLTRRSRNRAL